MWCVACSEMGELGWEGGSKVGKREGLCLYCCLPVRFFVRGVCADVMGWLS